LFLNPSGSRKLAITIFTLFSIGKSTKAVQEEKPNWRNDYILCGVGFAVAANIFLYFYGLISQTLPGPRSWLVTCG
jgi:hypothetical protein